MTFVVFQHVGHERSGVISECAAERGVGLENNAFTISAIHYMLGYRNNRQFSYRENRQ
jgi:hypothetical protein